MTSTTRFDTTSRAERYFVATLLPHLLMAEDFIGLKALFRHIFPDKAFEKFSDDFEVVSELDPLRDARFHNVNVKLVFDTDGRIAVPDLFLRWDKLFILLEGKFFTRVREERLVEQMNKEMGALNVVLKDSGYSNYASKCLILTVERHPFLSTTTILGMTWHEIIQILDENVPKTPDTIYALDVLRTCLGKAKSSKPADWDTYKFKALVKKIQSCNEDTTFVSFTGGLHRLANASRADLEGRAHYKLSERQVTRRNWITLREFKKRLVELELI